MRTPLITAAVVLSGLLGGVLTAPVAVAATKYSVSIASLAAKADVGQKVQISGSVRGPKSASKNVVLQRRIGTGSWANIATTRTTKSSTYVFRHTIATAGIQSFRVVAPRSGATQAGTSKVRSLTGWRWLNLADQPWRASTTGNSWVETGTFSLGADPARTYPKSISLGPESASTARFMVEYQPDCTRLVTRMGWGRRSTSGTTVTGAVSITGANIVNATVSETTSLPIDVTLNGPLEFRASGASASFPYVIFTTPKVYCSVNALLPFLEIPT